MSGCRNRRHHRAVPGNQGRRHRGDEAKRCRVSLINKPYQLPDDREADSLICAFRRIVLTGAWARNPVNGKASPGISPRPVRPYILCRLM